MLDHKRLECTGEWRLVMNEGNRHLECDACCALYVATPGRRKAAIDENLAGTFLKRLANEGSNAAAPDLDDAA